MKALALVVALVAVLASGAQAADKVISAGAGRSAYTATDSTAVTASLALSTGVDGVKTAIKAATATAGWDTVKTQYDTNVKATADASHAGEPVWDAFKNYFGSVTFSTDYFYKAQVGTAAGFTFLAGRKEQTEKTAMDMVGMHAVISSLYRGYKATDKALWDQGAAYFIGAVPGATTYGRADKRGADFGTLAASGESLANTKIIAALTAGKAATTEAAMKAQYDIIVGQYKVIYAQNALRYANLLDKDLATGADYTEDLMEGQAFWRVIAPWVAGADAAGAAVMTEMFDTTKVPNAANHYNYCQAKAIVVTALGVSAADLGALDEDHVKSAACLDPVATLQTGLPTVVTPAGTYTPAADVGASLAFSDAVRSVVALVGDNTNYAAVTAMYLSSGLRGIANMPRTGEPDWDKFAAHFGSPTWMSDLVDRATATPNTYGKSPGARAEIIEKTLMDAVAVQVILSNLHHATMAHSADVTRAHWDAGAATFMGSTSGRGRTVYERANKRGANYGTLAADGATATANTKIVTALNLGATGTATVRTAALATVRDQLKVIYAQATLRYAFLVDRDVADNLDYYEHQAEGLAFYNVIAPYVAAADPTGHAVVQGFFDIANTPDSYNYYAFCAVKAVMVKFMGGMASEMGTLESTSMVACATTLPTGLPSIVTPAGTYIPGSDVGAALSFSDAVKATTSLIGDATDYAKVKSTFKALGLAGSAEKDRTGETTWDAFRAYFSSKTWMTDLLYKVTDGITLTAGPAARAEIIEKTIRDAVATQTILSDLYRGTLAIDASTRRLWDAGAAKFLGTEGARGSTVYNRADKRGANYGTLDGVTSKANKAILTALTLGATASDTSSRTAQYHIIVTQIKVIYAQCTLRYAFLIDADVIGALDHAEHQAEGMAFWRVIAPWVKSVDANGAAYVDGIFDVSRAPAHTNHYCQTKLVLDKLQLNTVDMGVLEDTAGVDCTGKEVPSDAAKYFATAPSPPAAASPAAPRATATVAAVVVAAVLALFA